MGSREQNFYNQLAARMGFEAEAAEIQDLYLDRKYDEAAAAVPLDFIDRTALLGSVERMAEQMQALAESGVTTLNVSCFGAHPGGADRDAAHRRGSTRQVRHRVLTTGAASVA